MDSRGVVNTEFDGVFGRGSYRKITRRLFGMAEPSALSIDLENVTFAYATEVVPLIALDRYLRAQGIAVEILYPYDSSYWEIAGWRQLL